MALAALIVAIVAALIALASVAYTRRQAVASEAQAAAAKATAAIENKRLHDDLTPELAITGTESGTGSLQAGLTVELMGPPGLDELDEVTVRIRDDMPDRKPRPGDDLTQEQISRVIWGPYRLSRGIRNIDRDGRAHGPFRLPKHEPYPLQLEQTTPPSWTTHEFWRQYEDAPVRLEITCRRAGYEPWVLRLEAEVKPDPGSQVF